MTYERPKIESRENVEGHLGQGKNHGGRGQISRH